VVAVIIKVYRTDGSPDLQRWMVQCDIPRCDRIEIVTRSQRWLIPAWPDMPTYCPDRLQVLAMLLIGSALACPCGASDIRLHVNTDPHNPVTRWPNYADCAACGLILMINNTTEGA
jgi:hypothetical protein